MRYGWIVAALAIGLGGCVYGDGGTYDNDSVYSDRGDNDRGDHRGHDRGHDRGHRDGDHRGGGHRGDGHHGDGDGHRDGRHGDKD